MCRIRMRLFILLVITLLCHASWAQKPFTRDFSLEETGAPVKVNALAQGQEGYIWLATDIGLFRYNGKNFTRIGDSIHKPATALSADGGRVTVGYSNGKIGIVEHLFVRSLQIHNGPTTSVSALLPLGTHVLAASTEEQGVFVIIDNAALQINSSAGLSDDFVYGLSTGAQGNFLAATDMGINSMSISGNKFVVDICNTRHGLQDNIVSVIRSIPGSRLHWVGTHEGGISLYNSATRKVQSSPLSARWHYGQVNDILTVAGGRAWVATENGYLLEATIDGDTIREIHPYYYPGKNFRRLLADKAGNIWCGTTRGLTMMTGEYMMGLDPGRPYSLYDATALAWYDGALMIALKKELFRLTMKDNLPSLAKVFSAKSAITCLYTDSEKRLWVGTLGDGLYYRNGSGSFVKVSCADALTGDAGILSISGTKDKIWISGLKGVEELSYPVGDKVALVKHHGKKSGVGSDYVYQLQPDKNGNMWMATDGAGVCMYDGTTYRHWDSSFEQNSKVVYSISEDIYGDMWAATMYRDLYHFHENKWQNRRLPETQYADLNISAVAGNHTGQVFSVYQRCIDQWQPRSRHFRHFNSAMGVGIDSTSNVLNCVAKDGEGNVYIPYQHGVIKFRNQAGNYDIRPSVSIAVPTVFSKPAYNRDHSFGYDENYIGFSFDGIGFANAERFNYRYKLQGYNDEWIYTNDASVSFPKLSPGDYTFRVQVALNPAFEYPNEDQYSFTIATPFWRTDLFYVLAAFFIIGAVYLYIKLREKRLKGISRLQQERMKFEYEHLKSQVNPHFLFNSLYALSILIEEKRENAVSYTVHLADLYRNMLAHSKKDLIPLKEELEILMNYVHIQQTRFGDALKVEMDIPVDVMERRKIVPLAIQLLVENAIKHNVVSMGQPLVINISATKDEIVVSNIIRPKISKEKSEGIGLKNIKQRYGLLTKLPVFYGIEDNRFVVKLPLL